MSFFSKIGDWHRNRPAVCCSKECANPALAGCEYMDRTNKSCNTAWCSQHWIQLEGRIFCRRHAGVVSALPGGTNSVAPLPDINNRAPSLVSWVARDLDLEIRQLLSNMSQPPAESAVLTDPVFLVVTGPQGARSWERLWRLHDSTGLKVRISLIVAEENDAEMVIKVGRHEVGRLTPDWIKDRSNGNDEAHLKFRNRVLGLIREALP